MKNILIKLSSSFVLVLLFCVVSCTSTNTPPKPMAQSTENLELSTEYSALDSNDVVDEIPFESVEQDDGEWNEDYQ